MTTDHLHPLFLHWLSKTYPFVLTHPHLRKNKQQSRVMENNKAPGMNSAVTAEAFKEAEMWWQTQCMHSVSRSSTTNTQHLTMDHQCNRAPAEETSASWQTTEGLHWCKLYTLKAHCIVTSVLFWQNENATCFPRMTECPFPLCEHHCPLHSSIFTPPIHHLYSTHPPVHSTRPPHSLHWGLVTETLNVKSIVSSKNPLFHFKRLLPQMLKRSSKLDRNVVRETYPTPDLKLRALIFVIKSTGQTSSKMVSAPSLGSIPLR